MIQSHKRVLIWMSIIGIGTLAYLILGNLSPLTQIIILVFGYILYLDYKTDKRLRKIENAIGLLQEPPTKPVSYKIGIFENIEWPEMIKHCFPNLKTSDEVWNFVESLFEDPNLIEHEEKEEGLFRKSFSFIVFCDGLSGLTQYWSNNDKTFLDELQESGHLLGGLNSNDNMQRKFGIHHEMSRTFVVAPEFIGFQSEPDAVLGDGSIGDVDKISQIPLYDIIDFFKEIYKNTGYPPREIAIKKFSKKLQDIFDKHKIKYEMNWGEDFSGRELIESKWVTENDIELRRYYGVHHHVFKTPYYWLDINLEFFDNP